MKITVKLNQNCNFLRLSGASVYKIAKRLSFHKTFELLQATLNPINLPASPKLVKQFSPTQKFMGIVKPNKNFISRINCFCLRVSFLFLSRFVFQQVSEGKFNFLLHARHRSANELKSGFQSFTLFRSEENQCFHLSELRRDSSDRQIIFRVLLHLGGKISSLSYRFSFCAIT